MKNLSQGYKIDLIELHNETYEAMVEMVDLGIECPKLEALLHKIIDTISQLG